MSLSCISPIDGRYSKVTQKLTDFYSEWALIKYRIFVEIEYFIFLGSGEYIPSFTLKPQEIIHLREIFNTFNYNEAQKVKEIELRINHDVKAVEYYIKDKLNELGLSQFKEFVHFGLTSQDINNTAIPLLMKEAQDKVLLPIIKDVILALNNISQSYKSLPMLARTHGQPASPTTLGKEFGVFVDRLRHQYIQLENHEFYAKFGGATGNLNAHKVSMPHIHWPSTFDVFIQTLGLKRHQLTTQIAHYDDIAALCQNWIRANVILIDFCRDIWTYISMDYFKQNIVDGEVGSSAMPHKVNPIDFENAEGNLSIANALFAYFSEKLPISRLQRDLTDSTVLRNIGVPFSHSLIAMSAILKGIPKLACHKEKIKSDLDDNYVVVAEAIQNVLRLHYYPEPYEALKNLTRGKNKITKDVINIFIDSLEIDNSIKDQLKLITPHNYVGYMLE